MSTRAQRRCSVLLQLEFYDASSLTVGVVDLPFVQS